MVVLEMASKRNRSRNAAKDALHGQGSNVGARDVLLRSFQPLLERFRHHSKDSGSSEVQIIRLTVEIQTLTVHLKINPNDNHTKRGLVAMVSQRRRLLKYLQKVDRAKHIELVEALGIRS